MSSIKQNRRVPKGLFNKSREKIYCILVNLLSQFILFVALYLVCPAPTSASSLVKNHINLSLINRQTYWPEWTLPGPFHRSGLKRDIIYPVWFPGLWIVEMKDLKSLENNPIEFEAYFKLNNSNEVVGERSFNALSVGKAILGDQLLSVKDDPNSPNRQLATFGDHIFLETKVIGRNQYFKDEAEFFVDELSLQIYHNLGVSRVTQVETLSKYQLCKPSKIASESLIVDKICGEQWQAIYSAPGESINAKPVKTSHYQLILRRLKA